MVRLVYLRHRMVMMDDGEFELSLGTFVRRVRDLTLDYFDANPNWRVSAGLTLSRVAMESLRYHIEDPLRRHVTWDNPSTMVPISVTLDDDLEPLPFIVGEDNLRNEKTVADGMLRSISDMSLSFFLYAITRGVAIIKQGQEHSLRFPEDISRKLKRMTKSRREKRKAKLLEPEVFSLGFTSQDTDDGEGVGRIDLSTEVSFLPLYIDYNLGHGFYPVCVTLRFAEGDPKEWTEKQQGDFWQGILETMNSVIPEGNLEFLSEVIADSGLVDILVSEAVSPDHAGEYEDGLKRFASWEAWHVENTGKFAALESGQQTGTLATRLSIKQQKDYQKHEYQCYCEVYIPGSRPRKLSNRVEIDGRHVTVPDYLFPLLLRLVGELKKGKGGWVDIDKLVAEHTVNDPLDYRWYGRLRTKLGAGATGNALESLLENDGDKSYRISTHPDFVTYDRSKLLCHPKGDVQRMAKMLPSSSKPKK
jgi:hypothetical protein